MKINARSSVPVLCYAIYLIMLGSLAHASTLNAGQFENGKKAKVKGTIVSRNGALMNVKDAKTGSIVVVSISGSTTIEREKGAFKFRRADMDATAMVPGLGIEVEGVGNAKGQLDATKISFSPDDFAIEVAEEQQIEANKTAAQKARGLQIRACQKPKVLRVRPITLRARPITRRSRRIRLLRLLAQLVPLE